jgi:hypothetical protein
MSSVLDRLDVHPADIPLVITSNGEPLRNPSLWAVANRLGLSLESSYPGVFAAGDVRASSTKRVASAVGEGSVAVQYVHPVPRRTRPRWALRWL